MTENHIPQERDNQFVLSLLAGKHEINLSTELILHKTRCTNIENLLCLPLIMENVYYVILVGENEINYLQMTQTHAHTYTEVNQEETLGRVYLKAFLKNIVRTILHSFFSHFFFNKTKSLWHVKRDCFMKKRKFKRFVFYCFQS